ncbi:hypothetical protein HanRHA438_Chr13g0584241 [Helianthus annuus]|nr:hypothetical protein HanRHA438_Chr13g0584241 [Helianthus annuus]
MEPFKDMAKFLRQSRINKALTDRTKVYQSHVRMFWRSARYDEKERTIYSVVQKKDESDQVVDIEVKFDVGDVRRVMGFSGQVNGKYLKSMFSRPYKFLVHCVLHALSHRKGAYDEPSDYIMNIFTCLVLNRPYNISQVIFDHMVDNIRGEKYIMYPRFIQMLIDDPVRDLPKDPADKLKLHHIKSETLSRLSQYKGLKKDEPEPRAKRMICMIENQNYVALENDAWRHENYNSEDDTDSLREIHEKKLRYWFINDGKRKRTPKASPNVTAPKVPTPKIVVKGIVERGSHRKRPSKKSPPRLVDETVIDPTRLVQQGVDLMKETLDDFIKRNEEAAKTQGSSVEKVAESSKKDDTESVKEKEPEGVVHIDTSDADDESTDTEYEIDKSKIGVGKITLKKKPQKKKKGSDEEDETYIPTPQAEKKKGVLKRKANPQGVLSRRVRARKGSASVSEIQSGKSEKHVLTSKGPKAGKDQNVEAFEVQQVQSTPEVEVEKVDKPEVEKKGDDDDEVVFTGERISTPPPPPENLTIHIPNDAKTSKPKKTTPPYLKDFQMFVENSLMTFFQMKTMICFMMQQLKI